MHTHIYIRGRKGTTQHLTGYCTSLISLVSLLSFNALGLIKTRNKLTLYTSRSRSSFPRRTISSTFFVF
ncbi:hypothetical protein BCV72DRAFT_101086 [Rhizopus microsporus var. microsporus]|uniref:Uncharacterized protein n=1 Tax=Rhizopus microsporus var. microsporus TaxID=86635 RepID=A0A1X0QLX4_RHIZD|nr:hypothetical protein BCV72DRAFT_101086 [Rhizopus microsporus var. microsporus]